MMNLPKSNNDVTLPLDFTFIVKVVKHTTYKCATT